MKSLWLNVTVAEAFPDYRDMHIGAVAEAAKAARKRADAMIEDALSDAAGQPFSDALKERVTARVFPDRTHYLLDGALVCEEVHARPMPTDGGVKIEFQLRRFRHEDGPKQGLRQQEGMPVVGGAA